MNWRELRDAFGCCRSTVRGTSRHQPQNLRVGRQQTRQRSEQSGISRSATVQRAAKQNVMDERVFCVAVEMLSRGGGVVERVSTGGRFFGWPFRST